MDIATITSSMTAIGTAIDIAKTIRDSGGTLKEAEMKLKLADIIVQLADAKVSISDFKQLLSEKDDIIRSLEERLRIKENLKYENSLYWLINDSGGKEDPFCHQCYDNNEKLIHLLPDTCGWYCPTCKNNFSESNYRLFFHPSQSNRNPIPIVSCKKENASLSASSWCASSFT